MVREFPRYSKQDGSINYVPFVAGFYFLGFEVGTVKEQEKATGRRTAP